MEEQSKAKGNRREKGSLFYILLSTGFGSGFFPFAPGTAGTCAGLLLYLFISRYNIFYYIIFIVILFIVGVWVSGKAEVIFDKKDHQYIVIDEIAGFFIAMLLLPRELPYIIAGFILFRALDIVKPLKRLENFQGGLGVMLDDAVAGAGTNIALQLFRFLV